VDEGFVVSNANVEMDGGEHAVSNHDLFNASMAITPPMAGPFLDINMFEQSLFAQEPSACVNPIDTIDARLYAQDDDPDSPCPPSSSTLPENSTPLDALSMEAIDRIVSVLTTSAARGDSQESCVPVSLHHVDVPDHNVLSNPSVRAIGIESAHHIMSPKIIISTPTSSPFPSPQRQVTARPKNATRSYVQKKSVSLNEDVCRSVPTIPGTPVLDAHHGIELVDLLEKAERYRLRNPGQDLSKKWLAAFAGKLSTMGELLDDFRCYVIGCSQTNKRRDHILIHVGSHVDQRPFPCGFWCVLFSRFIVMHPDDNEVLCDSYGRTSGSVTRPAIRERSLLYVTCANLRRRHLSARIF
jgi:hypothetical protein